MVTVAAFKEQAVKALVKKYDESGAKLGCFAQFQADTRIKAVALAVEAKAKGVPASRSVMNGVEQTAYIYQRDAYRALANREEG